MLELVLLMLDEISFAESTTTKSANTTITRGLNYLYQGRLFSIFGIV